MNHRTLVHISLLSALAVLMPLTARAQQDDPILAKGSLVVECVSTCGGRLTAVSLPVAVYEDVQSLWSDFAPRLEWSSAWSADRSSRAGPRAPCADIGRELVEINGAIIAAERIVRVLDRSDYLIRVERGRQTRVLRRESSFGDTRRRWETAASDADRHGRVLLQSWLDRGCAGG